MTHARSPRALLIVAGAVGALLLAATTAVAVITVPYKKTGTLTVKVTTRTAPIRITFKGTLPKLRKGEYVSYTALGGIVRGGCNGNGYVDELAGPNKPPHKSTDLNPALGFDGTGSDRATWCSGTWTAQAQVYTPRKNGTFSPRLTFNRKTFKMP